MIGTKRFLLKAVVVIMVFVFSGTSGILAEAGKEPVFKPIAEEMIGSGGISWAPKVNYYRLVLTIARPDGSVFRKTFDSGVTPYAGLSGILGESADDGAYTYELTLVPDIERRMRSSNEDTLIARTRDRKVLPRKALTQSGGFTVKDGMVVTPGASELRSNSPGGVVLNRTQQDGISRPQDQVILDDLIVDGSICVGFDCVNGESFGFDTIRLKENNLRIKFQDTSNSASFPSNDWQITANDSANGGANKFSIDDIDGGRTPFTIEASAPSHSLYVDDGGRVGFGTSTPAVDLHVKSGNTPALRLEQDGSSGFTAQTWDVAGNEANFFVRDATNGSTLPIRIRPGAPTSSIDIAADGDIGFGTDSPEFPLEIERNGANAILQLERKDGGSSVQFKLAVTSALAQIGSRTNHPLKFVVNNAAKMTINTDGQVGIANESPSHLLVVGATGTTYCDGNDWYPTSSREYKENIRDLSTDKAMEALTGLNPVRYNYKTNKEEERVGFIAEDVPGLVAINGGKSLNAMDILGVLTKVVQQQQQSMKEQQKTIAELKKKIAELEKK